MPYLEEVWLDLDLDPKAAVAMLRPYPTKEIEEYIVDKRVGNIDNQTADLIEFAPEDESEEDTRINPVGSTLSSAPSLTSY